MYIVCVYYARDVIEIKYCFKLIYLLLPHLCLPATGLHYLRSQLK